MLATRRSLLKRLGGRLHTHWPRVDAEGGGVAASGLRERRLGEEGDCLRVQQPGALPQRDPLRPRRARPLPEARLSPHDFLKRHFNRTCN